MMAAWVAAWVTLASSFTLPEEPMTAWLICVSESLAASPLLILVTKLLLPSISLSPAKLVFELMRLMALRAESICPWFASISSCERAPLLRPSCTSPRTWVSRPPISPQGRCRRY